MNSLKIDAYEAFGKQWALLTAGTKDDHNAMTISWGGLGSLWNRSVATVYVRPSRYTYEFMERYEYFTISFYGPEYRDALVLMGKESGRDIDKDQASGLTPVAVGEGISYTEADVTLICKKLYAQDMDPNMIPEEILTRFYGDGETVHRMYIGQVVDVLPKERCE